MTDYETVSKALASGVEPAMLCATCPWDRYCVTPPTMGRADVEARVRDAQQQDQEEAAKAQAAGQPQFPARTLAEQ